MEKLYLQATGMDKNDAISNAISLLELGVTESPHVNARCGFESVFRKASTKDVILELSPDNKQMRFVGIAKLRDIQFPTHLSGSFSESALIQQVEEVLKLNTSFRQVVSMTKKFRQANVYTSYALCISHA